MNGKFEYILREEYFARVLDKGYRFFNRFRSGDLTTRLTEDLSPWRSVNFMMCSGVFRVFDSFCVILFCISIMFYMNFLLTFCILIPLPLMLWMFYKVDLRLQSAWSLNRKKVSETNNHLEDVFSNIKIIKSFAIEHQQQNKLKEILKNRIGVELENVRLWQLIEVVYLLLSDFGKVIVFLVGGYLVIQDRMSLGEFYAFYIYLEMLMHPLTSIPMLFISFKVGFVGVDRLAEIDQFDQAAEVIQEKGRVNINDISSLQLKSIWFRYNGEYDWLFKDFNLDLSLGEVTALTGKIGTGKSTLLKIILGLIRPERGEVFVNGEPLERVNLQSYWKQIGYTPQEVFLLDGTVEDNVLIGRTFNPDLFSKSTEASRIVNDLPQFADGFDTLVSHKGVTLSGGQRQRIGISRSLYHDPNFLVFDDSTSALDAQTEKEFWSKLNSLKKNKIILFSSHRPYTIHRCDKVIDLNFISQLPQKNQRPDTSSSTIPEELPE